MALQDGCFLLVDSNWDFSLELVEHIKARQLGAASNIIIAGDNTKQMLKMMFNEQIKDYCYCDFDNEISVSELATYLHQHHKICAVLFYALIIIWPRQSSALFSIPCTASALLLSSPPLALK